MKQNVNVVKSGWCVLVKLTRNTIFSCYFDLFSLPFIFSYHFASPRASSRPLASFHWLCMQLYHFFFLFFTQPELHTFKPDIWWFCLLLFYSFSHYSKTIGLERRPCTSKASHLFKFSSLFIATVWYACMIADVNCYQQHILGCFAAQRIAGGSYVQVWSSITKHCIAKAAQTHKKMIIWFFSSPPCSKVCNFTVLVNSCMAPLNKSAPSMLTPPFLALFSLSQSTYAKQEMAGRQLFSAKKKLWFIDFMQPAQHQTADRQH